MHTTSYKARVAAHSVHVLKLNAKRNPKPPMKNSIEEKIEVQ